MDMDKIISIIICVVCVVGLITSIVWSTISKKRQIRDCFSEEIPTPETAVIRAEVISKYVDTQRTGSYRYPNHHLVYRVIFRTEDGETKEYSVPIEIFNACEPHTTGDLVTVDGGFFDFGEGEEI